MLVADDLDRLTLRRVTARHWIVARLRAGSLDSELAGGISPETCDYLAARAMQLTSMRSRRQLAAGLNRLLLPETQASTRQVPLSVPVQRARVARAVAELGALRQCLLAPGPVPVRGVALVQQLLSDGASPLYQQACRVDLRDAAKRALHFLGGTDHSPTSSLG